MRIFASRLGLETIIAMIGIRDGQARALMRADGQRVPRLAPVRSQGYDDDLVVRTFDLLRPANAVTLLMEETIARLSTERESQGEEPCLVWMGEAAGSA